MPRSDAEKSRPDQGPWTPDQVRDTLRNPIYAGLGSYLPIVGDEEWIKANARLIREEGPEQYLANLLRVLRDTFGQPPQGEAGSIADSRLGKRG